MLQLLIVDDSKWTREGLSIIIDWASLGIEIAGTCANATKACEFMKDHKIDILISDIRMPGMDGLELAEFTHTNYPDIDIIMISAYKEFDYVYKAMQLGISGYTIKPIVPEDLLRTMEAVLKKREERLRKEQVVTETPTAQDEAENDAPMLTSAATHKIMSNVKSYIDQNIANKDLNLKQASVDLYINYYYLSKCFKSAEGISFTEYVTNKRLQIASRLLTSTSLHIYEICDQIGLEPKNFHSLFRKKYNVTPQEYRRNMINEKSK